MKEGSLEAPIRHPLVWEDPAFVDPEKIDEELRRVFDICHGCRRCFNLCDSFPRLFDLVDESKTGELDSVDSADFKPIVDACTLCDMCFLTKCPYVPPHEFDLDFPHLMLRYRAMEHQKGKTGFIEKQLSKTDRNGKLAAPLNALVNWATGEDSPMRPLLQATCGIHKDAHLPDYCITPLTKRPVQQGHNLQAPAAGRKVAIYATCFAEYNNPSIGEAMIAILKHNGVAVEVVHPHCCGMPWLEKGDIAKVRDAAQAVTKALNPYIDEGYDIIALVPSCALMLKFEWPLIMPDDAAVKKLSEHVSDASEYIVDIAKKEGLAEGLQPLDGAVSMHLACHARAQNMGAKSVEMLRLIPETKVLPIERCSGHGGTWGIMEQNFEVGLKVGKPAMRAAIKNETPFVASECPLAADHILQGMERIDAEKTPDRSWHPIELFAKAYGLIDI